MVYLSVIKPYGIAQSWEGRYHEDEKEGLLIKSITTRDELDEFEQQNIEKAMLWVKSKKFRATILGVQYYVKFAYLPVKPE